AKHELWGFAVQLHFCDSKNFTSFTTRDKAGAPTKFALWANEVIFDSEVRFVSEVSPDGEVMGKRNVTCAEYKLH
ncbi:MAG: hypothetical protein IJE25_04130, partial [Clostridia bacterium]|nr:hypothetical protein [Clostridia bacterium]